MAIEIEYNPKVYDSIIATGRFKLLSTSSLESITSSTKALNLKKIGEDFKFTCEQSPTMFPFHELYKILQVHAPLGADAYYADINNNVLSLSFFRK